MGPSWRYIQSRFSEFSQFHVTREQVGAVFAFAARSLDAPPGSYAEVDIPFR